LSKGRRHRGPEREADAERRLDRGHETTEEVELGNAAHAAEVGGIVPLDAARDAALPLLDHARLALQLQADLRTSYDRLIQIVGGSDLEEAGWLSERLAAAAGGRAAVAEAVGRWFGEVPVAAVDGALARVERALRDGAAEGAAWVHGGARVDVPAADTVHGAVDQLVGAVGGGAVLGLVRQLHLAVLLDEEEEEELIDPVALAADGG
jgi:hypothetical protein